nr:nitrile hydratase subunit beta [Mycolicibacterium komanii]
MHDMGGMADFGHVREEADEPTFHADWERRSFGLTIAASATGAWNVDMGRRARESLPAAVYLTSSYYEIWARGLEALLVETGLVTEEELAAGRMLTSVKPVKRVLTPELVAPALQGGSPSLRTGQAPARFAVGDHVVARNMHPKGHTRLPRYTRGKCGVIEKVHGAHVFPDTHAHGLGEAPQWLYTVRFDGAELWGVDAEPNVTSSIDAWESYLDPA